eukprot:GFKZ01001473.1.p1 GENE.GFKZ01001473.1~~GFKZ01001473.1.p1  ORF type:complete len:257 (+),score=41.49 GFKZ01001473.1:226-996(+)
MRTQTTVPVPDPDFAVSGLFEPYEDPVFQQPQQSEQPETDVSTSWDWTWVSDASPKRPKRHRTHYEAVEACRNGKKRVYKVGDTVFMGGEENETWVAQIVDLFQASQNDPGLATVLSPGGANAPRYDLMRCTLRWFYNYPDLNKATYRASGVSPWIRDEVFFSDHVEKGGFNDVTVIKGRVWMFGSKEEMLWFLKEPEESYDPGLDQTRVVRSFVNSNSESLDMRELAKGELDFLLKTPSTDENLYDTAKKRMAKA